MGVRMEIPKAVVFDLGKVLLEFDFQIFAKRLADESDIGAREIMARVVDSNVLVEYEYGRTSSEQFYDQVKSISGFRGDYSSFECLFGEIFTEIPEMVGLHRRLKESGLPTYIFSNTNDIAVRIIRQQFAFFGGFSDYVLSFEHFSMKPDSELYQVVEKVTGLKGSDLVFMDDKEENIHAAKQRGWKGIVHVNSGETEAALRGLGLKFD
jgi:FMN phosphatase YigB (HAD superfamily)